eukprot:TRINITY_DN6647_c0_g1_i1.p1 TRINITY_DN6647_c0_g1~~TRINITY_DN6647_c0_g1_i1.p1  ORF type:complete len:435 (+),score=43.77 TRINITY_DN6647_c0_g1_i1:66-1370(+)
MCIRDRVSTQSTWECDIYSAGCIFYYLITREPAFKGNKHQEILLLNKMKSVTFNHPAFSVIPQEALDLLKSMLEHDPEKRISANMALKHEYFTTSLHDDDDVAENSTINISKYQTQFKVGRINQAQAEDNQILKAENLRIPLVEAEIIEEQLTIPISGMNSPLYSRKPIINGEITMFMNAHSGKLLLSANETPKSQFSGSPKRFEPLSPPLTGSSPFAKANNIAKAGQGSEFLKQALLKSHRLAGEVSPPGLTPDAESNKLMSLGLGLDSFETSDSDSYSKSYETTPSSTVGKNQFLSLFSPVHAEKAEAGVSEGRFSTRVREIAYGFVDKREITEEKKSDEQSLYVRDQSYNSHLLMQRIICHSLCLLFIDKCVQSSKSMLYTYSYPTHYVVAWQMSIYLISPMILLQLSNGCLLYTSPSPRDGLLSRMPSSA